MRTSRERVARFLNAPSARQIVFTRGTTESINLVAQSFGRSTLSPGDEILITGMEHHSNIVPWQLVGRGHRRHASARRRSPTPASWTSTLRPAADRSYPSRGLVHLSNALGTINPVRELVALAHARGIPVLVDGAQSASHLAVDVQELDCDFFACSGHKIYGPTGVGVLYGREELLERMPPWQGGGDMIASVTLERSTWAPVPAKFEAGTPMIAEVMGLGAALDYVEGVGLPAIAAWEERAAVAGDRDGSARSRASGSSAPPATRRRCSRSWSTACTPTTWAPCSTTTASPSGPGHHCAQPVMQRFGRSGHRAGVVRLLQHAGRSRRAGRGLERVRAVFA